MIDESALGGGTTSYKPYREIQKELSSPLIKNIKNLPPSQRNRIEDIIVRTCNDHLQRTLLITALELCNGMVKKLKNSSELYVLSIRGSVVKGTVSYNEDVDIFLMSESIDPQEIRLVIGKFEKKLKEMCPKLKRKSPISVYYPQRKVGHQKQVFLEDPVVMDILNPQPIEDSLKTNLYEFLSRIREPVREVINKPEMDSISFSEFIRRDVRKIFKISYKNARGATAVTDTRLSGIVFIKEDISRNRIVEVRDQFIYEVLGNHFQEVIRYFGKDCYEF